MIFYWLLGVKEIGWLDSQPEEKQDGAGGEGVTEGWLRGKTGCWFGLKGLSGKIIGRER